jgi:hypothetical protein
MPNSLPSFGILSMEQFPALRTKAAQLSRYSTNFTADVADKGTAVTVGYQSPVSASQWNATNKYASSDETISSTTVTLAEPFYVEFYLSPNELASYGEKYLQNRMEAAAIGVLDEVRKKALGVLTATSTGPLVASVSSSAHNFNTVLSASNVLITSGSQGQQTFVAPPAPWSSLITDAKNANYPIASRTDNGNSVFNYALLPHVDVVLDASISTPVIATKDAVALALRLPPQLDGYNRTILADEQTGVAVAVDLINDAVGGKLLGRAHVSAGWAAGRPGAAARFNTP